MTLAYFIVRAEIVDSGDREAFDRWYETEHLPDAIEAFAARRAWRGWSDIDADVHYAFYEFDDLECVHAMMESSALARLAAEFDRRWGARVTRTRDVVQREQFLAGPHDPR